MEQTIEERHQPLLRTLRTWALLFAVLFVVDDLTFGWIFWILAQFDLIIAAMITFGLYWVVGSWVTLSGLRPNPGRVTRKALSWLQLEHKEKPQLHKLEEDLQNRITSVAWAIPMTMLFGGVFTTLWLRRRDVISTVQARWLAIWLCGLYALEPTAIHVFGIGWLILLARHALFG